MICSEKEDSNDKLHIVVFCVHKNSFIPTLVVKMMVVFSEKTKWVPVEIQFRTKAMDFWASLEHKMKYKKDALCVLCFYINSIN